MRVEHHHYFDPDLTDLLRELLETMKAGILNQESIMTTLADLSTALDGLTADFNTYKSGVATAVADALAAASAAEAPTIQALADKIAALDAAMKPATPPAAPSA